jgi:DNA-binding transcriptional ArsR family regulator
MAKLERFGENDLLAALGHPLRRQILRRMRDVEMISPRQLSKEFDRPVTNLAYHVRVLADCGAITLVRVKPVRGAIQHFYRSSLKQPWAQQIIALEPWDGKPSGEIQERPQT